MKKAYIAIPIALVVILVLSIGVYFLYTSFYSSQNKIFKNDETLSPVNGKYETIAYIGFAKEQQPFWTAMGKFSQEAAALRKITYLDLTPEIPSTKDQVDSLNLAIDQKVAGIIIGANLPSTLISTLEKAYLANIPVVAIDTNIDSPAVVSSISTDNLESARIAGDYIVNATNGVGTVLIICGEKTHPNSIAREMGVKQAAEKAGMNVTVRYADWEIEKAYSFTREELSKQNNITAIFGCWDPGIISAQEVVEDLGLSKKITLVGFDGLQQTYVLIQEGKISATIAQPIKQMAREGVETIIDYLNNQSVTRINSIPGILVTKDNVGYFLD